MIKSKMTSYIRKMNKRAYPFMVISSVFCANFFFASCGYDKTYEAREESLHFSNDALSGGVPLDDTEMAVALRICYAFRTKRSKFSVEMLDQSFNYNYVSRDCQSTESSESFSATLTQTNSTEPLRFESDFKGSYIREVQTDIHGYLSDICSDVLAGETPLNISEINNELYEYTFRSYVGEGDQVEIQIGAINNPNSTVPEVNQKLIFKILTNATSAGHYQGMVIQSKRYLPCEDNDQNVKLYQQDFVAP